MCLVPYASHLQTKLSDQLIRPWLEASPMPSSHTGAKHSGVTSLERLHHKGPIQVGIRGWTLHMTLKVRVIVESVEMTHSVNLLGKGHQERRVKPWSWSKIDRLTSLTKTK